ncbi:MAG: S26 family signal peptidase [Pirellulales bacterium]|nr:S26 family signal peptidase [Pirellulales bacterium]
MAKKKQTKNRRERPAEKEVAVPQGGWHALRETLESIIIAFVLAFLFRTFEAEAFVIPTGSMSPSLQGQHKDVCCSECGYRFRTTASSEGDERAKYIAQRRNPALADIVAGMCPMCRQTMAFRQDLPSGAPPHIDRENVEFSPTYLGDRILVNKYIYTNHDPDRWDVVVFKFPGNGEMNYIKRLVGLPNETLQVYQGDIFIRPDGESADFRIERKPPDKVRAMLQTVHDTDYESSALHKAGWPLRWGPDESQTWQVQAEVDGKNVRQVYHCQSKDTPANDSVAWLRYQHWAPTESDWLMVREFARTGKTREEWLRSIRPTLIRDFNAYNARHRREIVEKRLSHGQDGWSMLPHMLGLNWVSDLAVQCEVEVRQATGDLYLDLVEGGKHFTCRINLENGQAAMSVDGAPEVKSPQATNVNSPGKYHLQFCNVDDQLLLWVDDELILFGEADAGLRYDVEPIYGDRQNILPVTSESDLGDLAPVRVGARGADLAIHRLQVLRDIYYVSAKVGQAISNFQDYPDAALQLDDGEMLPTPASSWQLFSDPAAWPRFAKRQKQEFVIQDDQFFVMGDNSPESLDCRLWNTMHNGGKPGGAYLERRLLIGKAVCVFWPHSWGSIPGLPMLPGFPNFGDMRIVR